MVNVPRVFKLACVYLVHRLQVELSPDNAPSLPVYFKVIGGSVLEAAQHNLKSFLIACVLSQTCTVHVSNLCPGRGRPLLSLRIHYQAVLWDNLSDRGQELAACDHHLS
jgi:hypothetical protein